MVYDEIVAVMLIVACDVWVFSVLWKSLQEDNRLAPTAYR